MKNDRYLSSLLVCLFTMAVLLTGCDNQTATESDGSTAPDTGDNAIELKKIGFAQWDKKLKSYQPKIVVVDAWAMWCTPCIERFPKMVELDEKYEDKGVQFVSLNLDDHNDTEALANAETFLNELNAHFDHYHMDENLIEAFDHLDLIGVPAVLIYDGTGEQRYKLTGNNPNKQFTEDDIEEAVQALLEESA